MKLARLRIYNFRCFGPAAKTIQFENMTFVLGPNGTGKTSVLQGLAKMFSLDPAQRRIQASDFHVPTLVPDDPAPIERELWLEADFEFPELDEADEGGVANAHVMPAVPVSFAHMTIEAEGEPIRVRFRLRATIDEDGVIDETFTFVTKVDEDDAAIEEAPVSKHDRNAIQVHYLPARRNPADHISFSTNALIGRALRAANWTAEREKIAQLTGDIAAALEGNAAISGIDEAVGRLWSTLHKGQFYANPAVSFARSEVENLLRHLSISFTPGHGEAIVDFSRLSDGQQSLLYISLVLAMRDVSDKVLSGELDAFNVDRLRPAAFTLMAVEEPENSLSPHYLGRVIRALDTFANGLDAQAVVATHAPSLLRRVDPAAIRYLRLDENRCTLVSEIIMPEGDAANKYVREAVQAFPELYFARYVVLGEGDSEEVVLPRMLSARGILADDASVCVVPLGGRHVNHFWRLLNGLGIPHATLLDLDLARHRGGWGRISYAAKQLLRYADIKQPGFNEDDVATIPAWDDEPGFLVDDDDWTDTLEREGVFFSSPLDLDFMMLEAFGEVYKVMDAEREAPDETTIKAVLGKSHDTEGQYSQEQLELFGAYQTRFKLGSKPSWHIRAMSGLDDDELAADMPAVLARLIDYVETALESLPE